MAENLPKNLEIVATVTHSRHCANFISENETFVFDVNGGWGRWRGCCECGKTHKQERDILEECKYLDRLRI